MDDYLKTISKKKRHSEIKKTEKILFELKKSMAKSFHRLIAIKNDNQEDVYERINNMLVGYHMIIKYSFGGDYYNINNPAYVKAIKEFEKYNRFNEIFKTFSNGTVAVCYTDLIYVNQISKFLKIIRPKEIRIVDFKKEKKYIKPFLKLQKFAIDFKIKIIK